MLLDEADKVRLLNNMISEKIDSDATKPGNPIQRIQDK